MDLWSQDLRTPEPILPLGHFFALDFGAVAFFFLGFCASALPAADLDALLVRPSLSTFDAADAAFLEVLFFRVFL